MKATNREFWRYITVEPAAFFAVIALATNDFLNVNLYLQKTCRNNTLSVEPDLNTPCDDERRGLAYVSTYYGNASMLSIVISVIFTSFATTYSDITGKRRKAFIVLPIIGLLLQTSSAILQTIFWNWPPLLGIILNAVLPDIFGGVVCIMGFSKVYICDKSQPENRLTRITTLMMTQSAALFVGKWMSGYMLRFYGFFYSYLIVFWLFIASLVSAIALVKEDRITVEQKFTLSQVFSLKEMGQSFKIILFSKTGKQRMAIWILQFVGVFVYFVSIGENSVVYMYLRHRFHWEERQYSTYSAYRVATQMTGSISCTLVMSKILKVHDSIVGMFAGFADTLAAVGFYLATNNWQLYLVPLADIFHGIASSTCISFMSKFFTDKEFGRLYSVYLLLGVLTSVSVPLYNFVFRSTMDDHPNMFFLLSIIINGVTSLAYCATYFLSDDVR